MKDLKHNNAYKAHELGGEKRRKCKRMMREGVSVNKTPRRKIYGA